MAPRTPLLNPEAYFAREGRPTTLRALGIVLVSALLSALAAMILYEVIVRQMDVPNRGASIIIQATKNYVIAVFVSGLLFWFLESIVIHPLIWAGRPERDFDRTAAVVGEAEIVSIVLSPAVMLSIFLFTGAVPSEPQAAVRFLEQPRWLFSPVSTAIGVVSLIWRAWILGTGLHVVHESPRIWAFAVAFGVSIGGWVLGVLL